MKTTSTLRLTLGVTSKVVVPGRAELVLLATTDVLDEVAAVGAVVQVVVQRARGQEAGRPRRRPGKHLQDRHRPAPHVGLARHALPLHLLRRAERWRQTLRRAAR